MFGSHLSIAGGLHHALVEAKSLHLDCVQIFTKNQRQWVAPALTDEQIHLWQRHRRETGIAVTVSHDSYLINLASPVPANFTKSLALFRDELQRCEALGIPFLVTHPGAHVGSGEEAGLCRVADAFNQLHKELPGYKTLTCLETTAGQGSSLGWRFEQLRRIIDLVAQPERLAVCIDTAHLLEAGYDLTSAAGMNGVLQELDACLGLPLVRVAHINDSKTPRGSKVDRHEHIGHGQVAPAALATLLRHPHFSATPKILETPKVNAPDGRPWDAINLETLRELTEKHRQEN